MKKYLSVLTILLLLSVFWGCAQQEVVTPNNQGINNLQIPGTVSSDRVRGLFENSYNIVIIEDKKIKVDLKIVGGKRIPLENIVKNYTRFGEE